MLETSPPKVKFEHFGAKKSVKYELKHQIQEREQVRQTEKQHKIFNESPERGKHPCHNPI